MSFLTRGTDYAEKEGQLVIKIGFRFFSGLSREMCKVSRPIKERIKRKIVVVRMIASRPSLLALQSARFYARGKVEGETGRGFPEL